MVIFNSDRFSMINVECWRTDHVSNNGRSVDTTTTAAAGPQWTDTDAATAAAAHGATCNAPSNASAARLRTRLHW